ncbi:hypothetical protein BDF22DRAFT_742976 [Syncephalis plumigaleata]|nr:hypothetical protein BDF22DRAFT_742976 [Syncephalis plumigaleata]
MKYSILLTVALLGLYGSTTDAALYRRQNNGPIVGLGKECGGFREDPPRCARGLVCEQTNPDLPDLPGVCVKATPPVSGEDGPCGGFIINPPICAEGLVCKYRQDVADLPGKCVKPSPPVSGKCGPCGGFMINPPICAEGLVCKYRQDVADLPGVCEPKCGPPCPPTSY